MALCEAKWVQKKNQNGQDTFFLKTWGKLNPANSSSFLN